MGHGEQALREPITAVWGHHAASTPGAEPLVRGSGAKLPEAESFKAFVRLKEGPKLYCQYAKTV